MKKSILLCLILLASPFTLAEPKYKISDDDMKKIIVQMNKYEQCVYPEIKDASDEELEKIYAKWDEKSSIYSISDIFNMVLALDVMPSIIGKENTELLLEDLESMDYFSKQHEKFNHSNPSDKMTDEELVKCLELRQSIGKLKAMELRMEMKSNSRKNQQ
ncbi:DUF5358 family protein [Bibersteinia trehalosi]|uniref:DUF5358 family protein n=1 Tax=Bibersteinia trehalosi TaxID=47735 RepID=UPI004045F501